jgi:SAM-dependent methyltransferase
MSGLGMTSTREPTRPLAWESRLACPACGDPLVRTDHELRCDRCSVGYACGKDQLDLRPRRPKRATIEVLLEPAGAERAVPRPHPIPFNPAWRPAVDLAALPGWVQAGNGLTPELLSWLGGVAGDAGVLLDLGCGLRRAEAACRLTGLEYVGLDIAGDEPHVLGFGEALPFRDATFDRIFSLCVLASTTSPRLVCAEAIRVLKPGGHFVGTSQFLEPTTSASRFHATAYGLRAWLESAGFEVLHLETTAQWSGLDALIELGYFPRVPRRVALACSRGIEAMARRHYAGLNADKPDQGYPERFAGGFRFVAQRP